MAGIIKTALVAASLTAIIAGCPHLRTEEHIEYIDREQKNYATFKQLYLDIYGKSIRLGGPSIDYHIDPNYGKHHYRRFNGRTWTDYFLRK